MTFEAYNAFCAGLPSTHYVMQWRGSHVWKVGDKVFAIASGPEGGPARITFKVTPLAFELLKDQPGLRPAPHLASRGMTWIQHFEKPGLSPKDLKAYLTESHRLVAAGLSKKKQRELGLSAG